VGDNENDCFRLEEAAKVLDFGFKNRSLSSKQPGEFETFLGCIAKCVQKLIKPYLDKVTTTASYSDGKEVTSLVALKPIFQLRARL